MRVPLLLLAGLTMLSVPTLAQTPPPPRPHTVTVRGTAFLDVEPEWVEMLIEYRVSDNVKDNEKAREQEKSLRAVVQSFGIPAEKLVLDNLTAYGYGGFSKAYNTNVSLTRVYRLRIDKPAILNDLIPRLVQTGADNVNVARLENAQLDARKREVLAKALDNARLKAEVLAKQLGQQLGGALAVTEVVPRPIQQPEEVAMSAMRLRAQRMTSEAEATAPNLRTIRVVSAVDAEYELK